MKKIINIIFVFGEICTCLGDGSPRYIGNKTMFAQSGYIWIDFEEGGKPWMVGAIKSDAICLTDPGIYDSTRLQYEITNGICLRVYDQQHVELFNNCCGLTNVQFLTNYTGTIQIGTNFYTLQQLKH